MFKALRIMIRLCTMALWFLAGAIVFGQSPPATETPVPTAPGDEAPSSQEPKRLPIPPVAARQKALQAMQEIYGKKIQAAKTSKTSQEKQRAQQALAKEMLQEGLHMTADPAGRFVLLGLSLDEASQAGDGDTVFEVAGRIVALYVVDAVDLKLSQLFRATRDADNRKEFVERARHLMQQAAADERYSLAQNVGAQIKKRTTEQRLLADVTRIKRQADAFGAYQNGLATLAMNRADPSANLAVGWYLCLVRGDWKTGLPYLAKGSDEMLKTPAETEFEESACGAGRPGGLGRCLVGRRWQRTRRRAQVVTDSCGRLVPSGVGQVARQLVENEGQGAVGGAC